MLSLFASKTKKCPSCGSSDLNRTHRPAIVKLLSFSDDVRKYRCSKCFRTFYVRIRQAT